jgi:hypothetical protein
MDMSAVVSVMPVSVLVDICKAIEGDEKAKEKAAEVAIPIIPPFRRKLASVLMHVSDTDVRRWALNELREAGMPDGKQE